MKNGNKSSVFIADSENIRTFAMHYISKGGEVRRLMWAIFMSAAKHIRFHAPVWSINVPTAFRGVVQRVSVEPFFIFHQFYCKQTF